MTDIYPAAEFIRISYGTIPDVCARANPLIKILEQLTLFVPNRSIRKSIFLAYQAEFARRREGQ